MESISYEEKKALLRIWYAYQKIALPFSVKTNVSGVEVEYYILNKFNYSYINERYDSFESSLSRNIFSNNYKRKVEIEKEEQNENIITYGEYLIFKIENIKGNKKYSIKHADIPLDLIINKDKTLEDKYKLEEFLILNTNEDFIELRNKSNRGSYINRGGSNSGASKLEMFGYTIGIKKYKPNNKINDFNLILHSLIKRGILFNNELIKTLCKNDNKLDYMLKMCENFFKRSGLYLLIKYNKEEIPRLNLASSFEMKRDEFVKNIPINWRLFKSLHCIWGDHLLSNEYTWFANGRCIEAKRDGETKTINMREDFLYSFPILSEDLSFLKEIESKIDSGEKMVDAIYEHFNRRYSKSTIRLFSSHQGSCQHSFDSKIVISKKAEDIIAFAENAPEKMRKTIKDSYEYNERGYSSLSKSFNILNNLRGSTYDGIKRENIDFFEFLYIVYIINNNKNPRDFYYFEYKMYNKEDKNEIFDLTYISISLADHQRDLTNDTIPLFARKVFIPIMMKLADVKEIIFERDFEKRIKEFIIDFFIVDCKLHVYDLFRINKTVHNDMEWFTMAGRHTEEKLTEYSLKDNEGYLHEAFNIIRSDKYRSILELGEQSDWMPLVLESYTDEETGNVIIPLISRDDLIKEGEAMNSCVGHLGYDIKSASGNCRIFTVINSDSKRVATLEVEINNRDHEINIQQLRGPSNENPSEDVKKAVNSFVKGINDKKIKTNWSDLFKLTKSGNDIGLKESLNNDTSIFSNIADYDIKDLNRIREAMMPWLQFMPKRFRNFNIDMFKNNYRFQECVDLIKEFEAEEIVHDEEGILDGLLIGDGFERYP